MARARSIRSQIIDLVRALGVEVQQVGHAFAAEQGLHDTDLRALLYVLEADINGRPATAGQLGAALGLTSGAVTGVVDRLVRFGHVQRHVDQQDRRRAVLTYAPAGRAVAEEFFRPLGQVSNQVMDHYSDDQLATIRQFLAEMTDAFAGHRQLGRPRS